MIPLWLVIYIAITALFIAILFAKGVLMWRKTMLDQLEKWNTDFERLKEISKNLQIDK